MKHYFIYFEYFSLWKEADSVNDNRQNSKVITLYDKLCDTERAKKKSDHAPLRVTNRSYVIYTLFGMIN